MDIETLNALYSHAGWVTFTYGENGFPLALITTPDATAVITLYGAHLLSYHPHTDGRDVLFLSEKAIFQEGTPIRGGVPICWPWFGSRDHSPDHGVARSRMWRIIDSELLENDECALTFELTDTPQTYALWAHRFTLTLRVTVGKKLTMELTTHNDDTVPFTITQALHTYFSLHDITQTTIRGLEGCVYSDKTDHGAEKRDHDPITITGEVDRVYHYDGGEIGIEEETRTLHIASEGSKTAVVWNPWIRVCAQKADLDAQDYQKMVCVESATIGEDSITLHPNESFTLKTTYWSTK